MMKFFKKKREKQKVARKNKPGKKYLFAAVFFAIMAPAIIISKIKSRKKL